MLNYLIHLKDRFNKKPPKKNIKEDLFWALQEEIPYVKESVMRKEIEKKIESGKDITEELQADLLQNLASYYQEHFLLEKETMPEQMAYNKLKIQEYYKENESVQDFLKNRKPDKTYRYQLASGKRKAGKIQLLTAGRKLEGKSLTAEQQEKVMNGEENITDLGSDIDESEWVVDGIIFQPIHGNEFAIGIDGMVKKDKKNRKEENTKYAPCKFMEENDMQTATLLGVYETIEKENKKRKKAAEAVPGGIAINTSFYAEMKNLTIELPYPLNKQYVAIYKTWQKTNASNNTAPLMKYVTEYLVTQKMNKLDQKVGHKRRKRARQKEFSQSGARNALGGENLLWLEQFIESMIDREYKEIGNDMFRSQTMGFEKKELEPSII